jgi:hypothetical protein
MKNAGYSHVISGLYQLPLIEGRIPPQIISSPTPYQTTLELLRQKKSTVKLTESGSTVIVRVVNPLLTSMYNDMIKRDRERDGDNINTGYLFDYLTAAQQSNPSSLIQQTLFSYDMSRFTGAKTVEKQFNKTRDIKRLMKSVNIAFAEHTQIHQDAL